MDKTLAVILMVLFSVVFFGVGYVVSPAEVETKEVVKEVFVDVPVEVEVEKLVADSSEYLNLAVDDFMEYVDDEDKTRCDGDRYDFDEISVSKVYDEYTLDFDDEDYTVDFKVRLKYDEDSERSCRKTFDVEAYYEEDEKVEISL